MNVLSGAGTWLQRSLLEQYRIGTIQLDGDVITSLVSYCERAPPSDAKEYLSNMIGEANCGDIIKGYLQRRDNQHDTFDEDGLQDGMQVYVKPQMSEVWSAGSKKGTKNTKVRVSDNIATSSPSDLSIGVETTGLPFKSKGGSGKGKKTSKGVSLAEATEGKIIMSRGAPCQCQATRHQLVTNCLSCGRIVCEQEGEGPCNFCGALVLKEGSTYAGLEGFTAPKSDSEAMALAFKDRLVEFGRNSSQRTTVIDDQSDYFQIDENAWLSEEEKKAMRRRQEEIRLAEEAQKKKVIVSIDLLGRKVVMASDMEDDVFGTSSLLDGNIANERPAASRIKPNPYILEKPVFVNPQQHDETFFEKKHVQHGKRTDGSRHHDAFVKTGRVQHDDPFVSALNSKIADSENEYVINGTWKAPTAKERSSFLSNEATECMLDFGNQGDETVFDICVPQNGRSFSLNPPLLLVNQLERSQISQKNSDIVVLMPGMVLLKHWLPDDHQVEIVERCRHLGLGNGGFYQPSYGAESKMHLHMMCLGMNWEPTTRSYQMKRSADNAPAPSIPSMLKNLVARCLDDARHACKQESTSNIFETIPAMQPTICLANFYEHSGKLGLHQDRDESKESLKQGIPVVSFSIGDSATFVYGTERDVDLAETILLESGDALIFGGPSRMIYHGIQSILPQTAPLWLIERTNLRPGRLNLTFREL